MKRYVITISCLLCAALILGGLYYGGYFYIETGAPDSVDCFARTRDGRIELLADGEWQRFEMRGVNLGSGLPGSWSTDYAIDRDTYLRWFEQMQAMGANTIRVYSIQKPVFYRALKHFNATAAQPLYLLQGIWLSDYVQNSHMDAFDSAFGAKLIENAKTAVDAVHGRRFILSNDADSGAGLFTADVSEWVVGYVLGGEWTDVTVAYTDEKYPGGVPYAGAYLSTGPDASAFESMLTQAADALIAYETDRYEQQRLMTFANGRTTDPFAYPEEVAEFFRKCAAIDVEHIQPSDAFRAGLFASYSVYPNDLDYLSVMPQDTWPSLTEVPVDLSACGGNTYRAYLELLSAHHTLPVVVLEFGVTGGRGLAQTNQSTGAQEGRLTEREQGEQLAQCWEDIAASGCVGGCVFSWQDEWHKRSWNTMFSVDLSRTVYWSDAQSVNQHFGLLAFDPGAQSVCIVDGKADEWSAEDIVISYANGAAVSAKYDERYIYFLLEKPGYAFGTETLYLPIDITPKSGTLAAPDYDLQFDTAADFLIKLHTADDSALLVQSRYQAVRANFEAEITGRDAYIDPPAADGTEFEIAAMATKDTAAQFEDQPTSLDLYETGLLRLGNADPDAADYDSLTDFAVADGLVELRLPWALLNVADPSRMQVHDDYYSGHYGVEFIHIRSLSVGLGMAGDSIETSKLPLTGWGNHTAWHERLKYGYYALKACWTGGDAA